MKSQSVTENIMSNVLSLGEENSQPESSPNAPANPPTTTVSGGIKAEILKEQIIAELCTIFDPEIPVNIYELGLIYDIMVQEDGQVWVKMTLTSPACPVAGTLPVEVENKVAGVPGVTNVELELVWDPPYSMDMMSEAARLQLGLLW